MRVCVRQCCCVTGKYIYDNRGSTFLVFENQSNASQPAGRCFLMQDQKGEEPGSLGWHALAELKRARRSWHHHNSHHNSHHNYVKPGPKHMQTRLI
jgi:hypothetical protein